MVSETPDTKRIFPIARNPLSNSMMIPRNEKKTPNPVKPNPISVGNVEQFEQEFRGAGCIVQYKTRKEKCH